jgi:RNA polymerase sigma-70 factor (ECF subfamily)
MTELKSKPAVSGSPGRRQALEQLTRTHARALLAYCLSRLGDRHLAEDAVQETFFRFLKAAGGGIDNPTAWLFGTARRCCLELARKRRRGPSTSVDVADLPDSDQTNPDDASDQLQRALERLSDKQRSLIYMKHTQGMKCRQIAEATDLPLGTVTAGLARAYAKLRSAIKPQED